MSFWMCQILLHIPVNLQTISSSVTSIPSLFLILAYYRRSCLPRTLSIATCCAIYQFGYLWRGSSPLYELYSLLSSQTINLRLKCSINKWWTSKSWWEYQSECLHSYLCAHLWGYCTCAGANANDSHLGIGLTVIFGEMSCLQFMIMQFNYSIISFRTSFRTIKHKKKCTEPELALALNDIGLGSALEQILGDKQWVDDASGR